MKIGSRVLSKKLGVPVMGTVIGMIDLRFYSCVLAPQNEGMGFFHQDPSMEFYHKYKSLNPDCKNVCYVLYDQPIRVLPIREGEDASFEQMRFMTQPSTSYGVYPDTDLDLVDIEVINKEPRVIYNEKTTESRLENFQKEPGPQG